MSYALAHESSSPGEEASIVFLHPHQPFIFKEIIDDILRTRFCVPGSIFMVEDLDDSIPVDRRYRAIRLMLSDGLESIQALFKGDAHGLVQNAQVYPGCYIRAEKFELRLLEFDGEDLEEVPDGQAGHSPVAVTKKRKREDEKEVIAYLSLKDFVTVGWDSAFLEILEAEKENAAPEPIFSEQAKKPAISAQAPEPSVKRVRLLEPKEKTESRPSIVTSKLTPAQFSSRSTSSASTGHPSMADDTPLRSAKPTDMPPAQQHADKARLPFKSALKPSAAPASSKKKAPWISPDPTQPMKLIPLSGIAHLRYKANWAVNVLAVVTSLTDVVVSNLRPFNECTAELADPSTDKKVKLTVFHHPDTYHPPFNPRVGSVVLLPGVKNHTDGGLKKYWDENETEQWWFEEPTEYGWCAPDVARIRSWWDGQQQF
jgi:hypothetical protein